MKRGLISQIIIEGEERKKQTGTHCLLQVTSAHNVHQEYSCAASEVSAFHI